MRRRAGVSTGLLATVLAALAFAVQAAPASAAFGIESWEAGTCATDASPAVECTYDSPRDFFYSQVAGHPPFGITDFALNKNILGLPEGTVQDVRVDLPAGLSVNPEATAKQCTEAELEGSGCPPESKVGKVFVTPFELLGVGPPVEAPVYNIVPKQGEPAVFGFRVELLGLVDLSIYLVVVAVP